MPRFQKKGQGWNPKVGHVNARAKVRPEVVEEVPERGGRLDAAEIDRVLNEPETRAAQREAVWAAQQALDKYRGDDEAHRGHLHEKLDQAKAEDARGLAIGQRTHLPVSRP